MVMPSKFTQDNRQRVLGSLEVGASRRTAAMEAGIGESTLRRWLEKGKEAPEGSRWRKFLEDVEQAEAAPKVRALRIVYREMEDRPDLAWKFIERREQGFAPPMPNVNTQPAGPVVVALTFHDGTVLPDRPSTVIDVGEISDGEQSLPGTATS